MEEAAQEFDVERFNLRKLREMEIRKQHQIKVSNRFAAMKKNDSEDIHRAWKNINENIKTSANGSLGMHELKQNKPWLD